MTERQSPFSGASGRRWPAAPFFVELIAMVLLFSLCAALYLSFFAGAEHRSKEAQALSAAVFEAQSAAEALRAGRLEAYLSDHPGYEKMPEGYVLSGDGRTLSITLTEEEAGALLCGRILVTDDETGEELICLTSAALTGGGLQ